MKPYVLLLFLVASCCNAQAQSIALGYYITKTNDTVVAKIKIPGSVFGQQNLSKLFFKVTTIDSSNGTNTFKPADIKGFEFNLNGKLYTYYSKPTITQNNLKFLQPLITGQRTNLYVFYTSDQNGAPLGAFYTFEKAGGEYAFLNTGRSLGKFRDILKDFYNDNLDIQQLIDTKFQNRAFIQKDIIEIVQAVNK